MTLRVLLDHRFDRLADALIERFREPARHPLAEDTVIVPSLGVGRWLQQRIARRDGVCARVRIDFAGRFLWQVSGRLLPGLPSRSPFDPAGARWSVMRLLQEFPDDPGLAPLARRVRQATPADRLALAGEIAAQFERYLAYRRDWLERWQEGRWAEGGQPLGVHEAWQRWLWRAMLERLPGVSGRHPFDLLEDLLARDPALAERRLGAQRVAVLGAVGLSPEQFAMFARISQVADVSVFAVDPCRELWSDMLDPASLARVRAQRPDVAWLYESEPSVLGAWGRAQRDLVAQVLALEEAAGIQVDAPFREEVSAFDADGIDGAADAPRAEAAAAAEARCGRLQALQASVLLRSDAPWARLREGPDPSLQLHSTHGLIRQAEVLHDCLLDCFESIDGLRPQDVVVFCADVDACAAAIEAVFDSVTGPRRIPFEASGRRAAAQPLVSAAVELLAIAEGGMRLSALCAWLDNPAASAALRFDAQEAGELVRWLDAAGARWGLDASDGPIKHHWQAAIDRLLLGAAIGGEADCVGGVAPVAGAQSVAGLLERLFPLLDALTALRDLGRDAHGIDHWCVSVQRIFQALFGEAHRGADALSALLEAVADLREGASAEPDVQIDAGGFRQVLTEELDRGASAAVASGAVTVCPIGGLRGIPFRVVCLLGMDDGAFPRRSSQGELDLMLRAPRFGDRVARTDDRGVFLDALLAARDRVLIFHQGRDARDGSVRNPSTVVGELVEYVNAREAGTQPRLRATEHPLHAFSPRSFDGERPSYALEWEATARAADTPMALRPPTAGPLVQDPRALRCSQASEGGAPAALHVDDVRRALCEPAETWLRHALGLRLPAAVGSIDEDEPLWKDPRRDTPLVGAAARRLLAGAPEGTLREGLLASPQTAARAAGRVHTDSVMRAARRLVERALSGGGASPAQPRQALAPLDVRVSVVLPCDGEPLSLVARLDGLGSDGRQLRVSPYPLGASTLVEAWLAHAAWTAWLAAESPDGAASPEVARAVTRLAARDGAVEVAGAQAMQQLPQALAWSLRIRSEPLPLFPRSFYDWWLHDGDLARARTAMLGNDWKEGEVSRPWIEALHRGCPPTVEEAIEASLPVYGPLFDCCTVQPDKGKQRRAA